MAAADQPRKRRRIGGCAQSRGLEDIDIAIASHTLENGRRGGNETKHLPYGEGTLRAEKLRDALARFDRPATVISKSPDEASHQAIRTVLAAAT